MTQKEKVKQIISEVNAAIATAKEKKEPCVDFKLDTDKSIWTDVFDIARNSGFKNWLRYVIDETETTIHGRIIIFLGT